MNRKYSRAAAALSFAAALTMAATPALARDRHWGGGWGRHNDRIDAGDIFAGVLIIGGIAAIASAASSSNKAKRERERARDYQYPDQSYPQQSYPQQPYPQRDSSAGYGNDTRPNYNEPGSSSRPESRGLDSAVDRCAREIERGDRRIDVIDTVAREGDGWRVAGRITSGPSFACTVDRDGRVSNVNLDGRAL
jgi:hypothetical protein